MMITYVFGKRFIITCVGLLAAAAFADDGINLAADGKPLVDIVINSDGAIPAENTAARELSDYLKKITGAEFATVEEKEFKGGPAIYVGWTEFAKKNGADFSIFGAEEALLKTPGDSLIGGGGRPRGALYAAYELLEKRLGVRWYTPWIEHVPSKQELKLGAIDRRFNPAYECEGCGMPRTGAGRGGSHLVRPARPLAHPNLGRKLGPSARDYTEGRLSSKGWVMLFHYVFGPEALPGWLNLDDIFAPVATPVERKMARPHGDGQGWNLGFLARISAQPFEVPAALVPWVTEKPYPFEIVGTNEYGNMLEIYEEVRPDGTKVQHGLHNVQFAGGSHLLTTYMEADWGMGTADQRLLGSCPNNNWQLSYRKQRPFKDIRQQGNWFCSFTINDKCVSEENHLQYIEGMSESKTLHGPIHFTFIKDGPLYIGFRPLTPPWRDDLNGPKPAGFAPRLVVEQRGLWGCIHLETYRGAPMAVRQECDLARLGNGFIVEVASENDFTSLDEFKAWFRKSQVADDTFHWQRQVRYHRDENRGQPKLDLALRWDAWQDRIMLRALNGRSLPEPQFSCTGLDNAQLPWLTGDVSGMDHFAWLPPLLNRPQHKHGHQPLPIKMEFHKGVS